MRPLACAAFVLALAACAGPRRAAAPGTPAPASAAAALSVEDPAEVVPVAVPVSPPDLAPVFAPVPVTVDLSSVTVLAVAPAAAPPGSDAVALGSTTAAGDPVPECDFEDGCPEAAAAPDVVLPPPVLATPPVPVPAEANLVLHVQESISGSEEDVLSQTRVFVDGALAGETHVGSKSIEKRWGLRLAPGNHLFRFEQWVFVPPLSWAPLAAEWQPRERFIRVDESSRTVISLRFFDGDRRNSLQSSREPL